MTTYRTLVGAATIAALCITITPNAHAATLGERTDNGCLVAFGAQERAFQQFLFDDAKNLQTHEHARDVIAAVEKVYPDLKAGKATELDAQVAETYRKARETFKATKPTTAVTKEDIDLSRVRVRVSAKQHTAAELKPVTPAFPLEKPNDADNVDKAVLEKLNAAWLATPTGDLHRRQALLDAAERQAEHACATFAADKPGAANHVEYPKSEGFTPEPAPGMSGKASSQGSNFDTVMFAVIGVLLALGGILAALPQLGIELPFKLPF